ncbi:purine/pyrimidine permease [Planococcus shenhongbingii]|uniref:Purine/pyrimidine permease n=1 Tax=Planococcus shenhongbingii TaxID=3058398 RepID=A0ABT8NFS8_9BACL|nr:MULTISPECIES: purine/pyrimidine permease [unclassified Planococcus (in: firmicutes)]MDN7246751.1 purine/pyrimidine permease [Planococcus sp. N017]WKA58891.1 purine/pyrimidine permease [Planococcus sp. N016]
MMKNLFGGVQWAVFLLASSIAAPIAIANVFGMDSGDTALFVQRTIFILGIACLVQAWLGHRMPINEGPAGLWWGIFVIYAGLVGVMYPSMETSLQALQSGLLYSGLLFIIFAYTGVVRKMKSLLTPTITFVYLVLLVLQLSESIISGLLGIVEEGQPVDLLVLLGGIAVVGITFFLMGHKIAWVNRYSILLAITAGWLIFGLLGKTKEITFTSNAVVAFPEMLVFGPLIWDSGMFVTALFLTILLIANMMASVRVMEMVLKNTFSIEQEDRVKQASVASGINHILAGVFSAIGPVPISGAAGFVSATRNPSLKPFIIGGLIVAFISLFPNLMTLLAALPAPVAYAVIFAIFTKMVEMAFDELTEESDSQQAYKVSAFGLMIGVGFMFLPPESVAELPAVVAATFSNGLITGTLAAIAVEQYLLWRKRSR